MRKAIPESPNLSYLRQKAKAFKHRLKHCITQKKHPVSYSISKRFQASIIYNYLPRNKAVSKALTMVESLYQRKTSNE